MTITLELIASQLEADGHYDMQEFLYTLPQLGATCEGCIYDTEEGCICPEECSRIGTDYYTKKEEE